VEAFPELAGVSDEQLKALIEEKRQQEQAISFERRLLHGEIDLLRAELVARLRKRDGGDGPGHLSEIDVETLSQILSHRGPPRELDDELAELG
jgi:hypothetical protein